VWAQVLAADPGATVYQTLAWFDAARQASGASDVSRLYTLDDGRRLVLPLLRSAPLPGLHLDHSYPGGFGPGGLLATGGLRPSDVHEVLTDLSRSRAMSTRIVVNHGVADNWDAGLVPGVVTAARRVEVVDLDGGFGHVWKHRFQSSARQAVRKAERSGIVVEVDTSARLVPTFYQLYLDWTDRRAREVGLPGPIARSLARRRQSLKKFVTVASMVEENCRIWVARHEGVPIASIITLIHGRDAIFWRGYSDKAVAGPLRANNLLHRLAIENACAAGCRFYNMGESGGVGPLEKFKQTLGATPRRAMECRIERRLIRKAEAVKGRVDAVATQLLTARRRQAIQPRPLTARASCEPLTETA
jgi:hypothetical protein